MADKNTLFGKSSDDPDSLNDTNSLDDGFFEEFSFDDFDYDDIFDSDPDEEEPAEDLKEPDPKSEMSDRPAAGKVTGAALGDTNQYDNLFRDKEKYAPKEEIEPDDPMLSEFESALAAEIQRVTREQEAEKKRIAAIRAARHSGDVSARREAEERSSRAYVGGESSRSGGWSRRRRSNQTYTEIGNVREPVALKTHETTVREKEIYSDNGPSVDEKEHAAEEAKRAAREQERAKAAAARAERVKAARAAQAEAERLAAIEREQEEEMRRQEEAAKAAEEARAREEAEKLEREIAEREERNRIEREEATKRALAEKSEARVLLEDDDEYDDDDDTGSRGKTVVTVSVIMVILMLGVGAAMTYFWSNLSVNKPGGNAGNTAQIAGTTVSAEEKPAENAEAKAEATKTPEEIYREESRAADLRFEQEQQAALERAAELEREERNAALAEAGMEGLPDISTRELSEYLTEMPADGASICTTKSVVYSYDQMVKDLYFLTVRYPEYIGMGIIGNTIDERAIYQAVIGNANAGKHVVIYYALNANDYVDTVLAMNQLEAYCKARKNGTAYKNHSIDSIFEDVCIHVIPMANPDGAAISQYGIEALRTDEARAAAQAVYDSDVAAGLTSEPIENYLKTYIANVSGADLNCNFEIGWEEYTEGSGSPSSAGYKGRSALSENESQALVNIVKSVNPVAVIGYSSSGNAIKYGYGYDGPADRGVSDITDIGVESLVSALAAKTGYESVEMPKYDASHGGDATEYFLYKNQIPAVLIEAGSGDVPLNETQMSSIWNANSEIFQMIGNLYTNGL